MNSNIVTEQGQTIESAIPIVCLDRIAMHYPFEGGLVEAVADVTLDLYQGEFLSIVGPSGCGKSTVLQVIAGLVNSTSGRVLLDGKAIAGPPEGMVYLFQQYSRSLFPWMRVRDNVRFGFAHQRLSKSVADADRRCDDFLAMVGLEGMGDRYPWQLSGGMQQRVAIARALAASPRILLLDEPFSAVDALTRMELHDLMLKVWEENNLTIVLVTHDVEEAVYLSDRIVMLSNRPARVAHIYSNPLPRPRDPVSTPELGAFTDLRAKLLSQLLGRI